MEHWVKEGRFAVFLLIPDYKSKVCNLLDIFLESFIRLLLVLFDLPFLPL